VVDSTGASVTSYVPGNTYKVTYTASKPFFAWIAGANPSDKSAKSGGNFNIDTNSNSPLSYVLVCRNTPYGNCNIYIYIYNFKCISICYIFKQVITLLKCQPLPAPKSSMPFGQLLHLVLEASVSIYIYIYTYICTLCFAYIGVQIGALRSRAGTDGTLATKVLTQAAATTTRAPINCNRPGYTANTNPSTCSCATGFTGTVQIVNGVPQGCNAIPCPTPAYTGTPGACVCGTGYGGYVSYVNGAATGCILGGTTRATTSTTTSKPSTTTTSAGGAIGGDTNIDSGANNNAAAVAPGGMSVATQHTLVILLGVSVVGLVILEAVFGKTFLTCFGLRKGLEPRSPFQPLGSTASEDVQVVNMVHQHVNKK
jgi:hypothetical protein